MAGDNEQEDAFPPRAHQCHSGRENRAPMWISENRRWHHPPVGWVWRPPMEGGPQPFHPSGQRGCHGCPPAGGQVWLPADSRGLARCRGHQPAQSGEAPAGPSRPGKRQQDGRALLLSSHLWPLHWQLPVCPRCDSSDFSLPERPVWYSHHAHAKRSHHPLAS